MNNLLLRSIFLIITLQVIQGQLPSWSLASNVFSTKNSALDPFQDPYLQSILQLDSKALMQIPILDDEIFISELNQVNSNARTAIGLRTSAGINETKEDEQLLAQRQIEETWEDLVVAGPITINYIGNLLVLSSKHDFAFTQPSPNYVYQHVKHPNSFRATLVQIANGVYNAFQKAHSEMDRIQLSMQQIPTHLKSIFKLLTSASPRLIQTMLPISLDNIERIAKQCVVSAKLTLESYKNLTELLQEVTELTIVTYGYNAGELNKTSQLIDESKYETELLNTQLEELRGKYQEARETLQKARENYYNAFHAIPTRPKRIIGFIAVGFVAGFVGGGLGCLMSSCGNRQPPPIDNTAFENAKATAELALERLQEAEKQYDHWYGQILEKQNTLAATIIQLSQLNIDQTDYKTTIDILVRATLEIGEIQKQWTLMTRFFSILMIRAEATRETVLHEFIATIKDVTLSNETLDDVDREYFVLSMIDTADDIEKGAHLLYVMSQTYYDVSSSYMMNQIAGLSVLAVTQTDTERQNHLKQLAQKTLSTSAAVSRLALERKQEYEQRNHARQDDYRRFIQQLMAEELGASIGK